ncbi:IS1096 element passenger TnpR family protein [Paraburkholderia sp. 40]|uniref:IS1096 element passenger TnpR family protein n=1 Tax=Paraburkholderia sp. 40 TaxID=2991059 RepID=UPI003D23D0E5
MAAKPGRRNITLRKLHHILQAAFAWTDAHLHDFEVEGRTYAMGDNDGRRQLSCPAGLHSVARS